MGSNAKKEEGFWGGGAMTVMLFFPTVDPLIVESTFKIKWLLMAMLVSGRVLFLETTSPPFTIDFAKKCSIELFLRLLRFFLDQTFKVLITDVQALKLFKPKQPK